MKFDVYFRGGRWWVVYLVGVNIRYRSNGYVPNSIQKKPI
ncbi:hypothetical protein EMIT043CA1_10272 [Pseudomonas brassicacearum]